MKKPTEIEFKYSAEDIKLTDFLEFCKSRRPLTTLNACGYDHFYQNAKDPNAFGRHRIGPDMNQWTLKRKTSDANNFIRTEHNINLDGSTRESLAALNLEFGYTHNFSLYKNCFVHDYQDHILVYYICYNEDLKEIGRFIEIETDEHKDWESEEQAWNRLLELEKECKPLGLTAQARIKRSLYEMYKK